MAKIISEDYVKKCVRGYLKARGWNLDPSKGKHLPDPDITGFHPRWRKRIIIEAKGEGKSLASKHQVKHNAFPSLLGEILSRMDIKGNDPKKARIYALAFPEKWANTFKSKIKEMKWA